MALMSIQEETLTAIADAIRTKNASTATMTPAEMVAAIKNLSTDAAAPEMISVAITFKTFTGYFMYYNGSNWTSTYTGSATKTISAVKNFPIFICIDRSDYSLSSIRITSGTASTESAFMQDSNSACTYITPSSDCTLVVQGNW